MWKQKCYSKSVHTSACVMSFPVWCHYTSNRLRHVRFEASIICREGECIPRFYVVLSPAEWAIAPCKGQLTHWGWVTHICVGNLTIIGSDNGLSPGRRQAIIWTKAGILLIGPLGTNFSENSIEILTFSFTKMRLKVSSAKWRPFCLGLNELRN